jgi:uncharacterized protein
MSLKHLEVEVDILQINAYVTVTPGTTALGAPNLNEVPTGEQILAELRAQGVVFGLRFEALEALIKEQRWGEKTLAAQGLEAQHGENGRVEYFFARNGKPQPKLLEDGHVDYRELGLIQMIKKDDLLARIIPPTEGTPGTTVLGRNIPARPGDAALIKAGHNTYFRDPEKHELCAQETGSVSLVRGVITVENSCVIESDVDFSTGNLNFPGDVIIKGDVKTGFSVKAGGKIEVRGIVEDGRIECRGDLLIRGGFHGSGKGFVRCGGEAHVKFIENQTLEADGSVYIAEGLLHARVISKNKVFLTSNRGILLGGFVAARSGIIVKTLGNTQYLPTVVEILPREDFYPVLNKLESSITLLQVEITRMQQNLTRVNGTRAASREERQALEAEKVRIYDNHVKMKSDLLKLVADLNTHRAKLNDPPAAGMVQILRKAFPGVKITQGDIEFDLKQEYGKTVFKGCGTEIEALSPEAVADENFTW